MSEEISGAGVLTKTSTVGALRQRSVKQERENNPVMWYE